MLGMCADAKDQSVASAVGLPRTGTEDRGEFHQRLAAGHCLVWLHPLPSPVTDGVVPPGLAWQEDGRGQRTLLVDLDVQPVISLARTAVSRPTLVERDGLLAVEVPSGEAYLDVSRSPIRFEWVEGEGLSISTASDRAVVWVGLSDLRGRLGREVVPAWSAVGVGPVVLWYVPRPVALTQALVTPALGESSDFYAVSQASDDLVRDVRRRAERRVDAPPTAVLSPWTHGEGFILAGETGVGKNVLARAVRPGAVSADRFTTVQPEEVRGWTDLVPFYGAHKLAHDGQRVRDQGGRLDVLGHADGVLLFDEIHSLDDEFRYRLLELLTYWTFRPRGDTSLVKPIRGLALFATSRLEEVRDAGRFPADLFFRMGGDTNVVELPPLRQRRWELPRLAELLLQKLTSRERAPAGGAALSSSALSGSALSGSALRKLLLHGWPGNFRELEQCLVEAFSLTGEGGIIQPEAFTLGTGESAPHARPQSTGAAPRPTAGHVPRPTPADLAEALGLADRLHWPDLFLLAHRLPDRAALTEVLVAHRERSGLPGANARSVNKEIGRLIRCDRFPRSGCQRCFSCRLVTGGAREVIARLDRTARDAGLAADAVIPWIARGVERLVVDRLGRDAAAWHGPREALQAAGRSSAADLEAALAEVARMLGDGPPR
jgi:transcriptional regulator with AAA-type ATPase domain